MTSLRIAVQSDFSQENEDAAWIETLLDSVSIRSRMPGRIRFHLGFEGDEILADTLRREVQKLDSVQFDNYSVRTRNALVTFSPRKSPNLRS